MGTQRVGPLLRQLPTHSPTPSQLLSGYLYSGKARWVPGRVSYYLDSEQKLQPRICVCPCRLGASEHLGLSVWEEALHSASSLDSHRGMRAPQPGGAPSLLSRPRARSAQEPDRA